MKRREFITLLGGAAVAWPLAAHAQQTAMPIIGFLSGNSPDTNAGSIAAFRQGLSNSGYVEGQNVKIEYRWANGQYDRLPTLLAELIAVPVSILAATGGDVAALTAKAGTSSIPIVFANGGDPVQLGLVTSLNRPGGNITGASWFTGALAAKRLGLLRELVPTANVIAMLVNPANTRAVFETNAAHEAAQTIGCQIKIVNASSDRDFEPAFADMAQAHAAALIVVGDPLFATWREQLAALAARQSIPAIYSLPVYVQAGGLMSYGADTVETYRQAGIYTGRILKGAKPADLPVVLPTKYELVINLKTAKALGLNVPATLLARADEVIE
jgi:putative tryptophan/tyrosine transport system substrate-binding protein